MPTYVAFLRAINLGAHRKFPKDAIAAAAERAGCTEVETYLNTGNLRVATRRRTRAAVEEALEAAFLADRGFEVPTIAVTPAELRQVSADALELAATLPAGVQYVSFLKQPVAAEAAAQLEAHGVPGEHVRVRDRAVHLLLEQRGAYHSATMTNAEVERRLGVATNRTLNVVHELARRWG